MNNVPFPYSFFIIFNDTLQTLTAPNLPTVDVRRIIAVRVVRIKRKNPAQLTMVSCTFLQGKIFKGKSDANILQVKKYTVILLDHKYKPCTSRIQRSIFVSGDIRRSCQMTTGVGQLPSLCEGLSRKKIVMKNAFLY